LDGWHGEEITGDDVFDMVGQKARHVGDGGLRTRGRYFSTVDLATVIPSLRSSPMMRGEPQVGLLHHMSRIKSRTSLEVGGRLGLPL
jgi:hypothetical protein